MIKEKTIVCVGIFLILAVLTSCAFYYSTNGCLAVNNNMECTGRVVSFELPGGTENASETDFSAVSHGEVLLG